MGIRLDTGNKTFWNRHTLWFIRWLVDYRHNVDCPASNINNQCLLCHCRNLVHYCCITLRKYCHIINFNMIWLILIFEAYTLILCKVLDKVILLCTKPCKRKSYSKEYLCFINYALTKRVPFPYLRTHLLSNTFW